MGPDRCVSAHLIARRGQEGLNDILVHLRAEEELISLEVQRAYGVCVQRAYGVWRFSLRRVTCAPFTRLTHKIIIYREDLESALILSREGWKTIMMPLARGGGPLSPHDCVVCQR